MRLTARAHHILDQLLRPGDLAIDATAGNGHDTLKLAQLVGHNGKVIAIDLQAQAIESTRARLETANQIQHCQLIQQNHASALTTLAEQQPNSARAITFNLGYLPGSDKQVQTTEASTLPALNAALRLLSPGGKLLVTAYRGHHGGQQEAHAVEHWFDQHPQPTTCFEPQVTGDRIPPILWVLENQNPAPTPHLS